MNQQLLSKVGNNQRIRVLTQLKHTDGMGVRELAAALKMSYMGVKQHCLELERRGFVRSSSRSVGVGRPELIYCATEKAMELFTEESREIGLILLDSTRALIARWAEFKPETIQKISKHAEAIAKILHKTS
jgi:predicted ArsR family transcriptional regulator